MRPLPTLIPDKRDPGRTAYSDKDWCRRIFRSDDAAQTVYHATCALELATDILVDLYTFFSPPAPFQPFFVLRAPDVAAPQQAAEEDG